MPQGVKIDWELHDSFIQQNYIKLGRRECAKQLGLQVDTVAKRANKLGLKTFEHSEWTKARTIFLKRFYPKLGAPFCSRFLKISVYAVNKQAQKVGVKRQAKNIHLTSTGHVMYSKMENRKEVKKLVHRMVVEEYLGRTLKSYEIVHHIDDDKTNNELSNLALVTRAEHVTIHRQMLVEAQWGESTRETTRMTKEQLQAEKELVKRVNVSVLERFPKPIKRKRHKPKI